MVSDCYKNRVSLYSTILLGSIKWNGLSEADLQVSSIDQASFDLNAFFDS
jgi:hypothetical protein